MRLLNDLSALSTAIHSEKPLKIPENHFNMDYEEPAPRKRGLKKVLAKAKHLTEQVVIKNIIQRQHHAWVAIREDSRYHNSLFVEYLRAFEALLGSDAGLGVGSKAFYDQALRYLDNTIQYLREQPNNPPAWPNANDPFYAWGGFEWALYSYTYGHIGPTPARSEETRRALLSVIDPNHPTLQPVPQAAIPVADPAATPMPAMANADQTIEADLLLRFQDILSFSEAHGYDTAALRKELAERSQVTSAASCPAYPSARGPAA